MLGAFLVTIFAERGQGQSLVRFSTPDGGVVYGELRGAGEHLVVFAHGGQFAKESWNEQATALLEYGFQTLTIDQRGRGRSRGPVGSETDQSLWYLDVMGAVSYARALGVSTVSVVGASWGGWAAARASTALESGAIDQLVLLAASPIDEPERMQGNKLFIAARDDFMGSGTLRLPGIREQFERAPEPKALVVLDGSAHAQHIFGTEQGPRLFAEIVQFLEQVRR